MPETAALIDQFENHLKEARRIADEMRDNEKLHRLAMDTVFALQDCHEALVNSQKKSHPSKSLP